MRGINKLAIAAGLCAAAAAHATVLAESTFDTGAEGWKAGNGASNFTWHSTGGHPGGYVSANDAATDKVWAFIAPDSFLGNMSAAFGGTLSYDLKSSNPSLSSGGAYPEVKLIGGPGGLVLVEATNDAPGKFWNTFSVQMTPGAWHIGDLNGAVATAADLQSVLGNLTALYIRGEFSLKADVGSLDNVVLSSAPVPEPEQSALLLAGLAALGAVVRRKQQR